METPIVTKALQLVLPIILLAMDLEAKLMIYSTEEKEKKLGIKILIKKSTN